MPQEIAIKINQSAGKFERYEVESAFQTLKRADEVRKNKPLIAAVKKYAAEEVGKIRSIQDLKDAAAAPLNSDGAPKEEKTREMTTEEANINSGTMLGMGPNNRKFEKQLRQE